MESLFDLAEFEKPKPKKKKINRKNIGLDFIYTEIIIKYIAAIRRR